MTDDKKIEILYDDQCPVCRGYCTKVELKEGELALLDARKNGDLLDEVTAQGLDIDEGMVVKAEGKIYYGSEAMREIVKRKKSGPFERFFFGGKWRAKVFYGISKEVRNIVLRVMRIPKIKNLGSSPPR